MKLSDLIESQEDDEYEAFMTRFHNMSEEEQLRAIREDPHNIMYMSNASKRVMLAAVQQDGSAIDNFIYDLDINKDRDIITAALTEPSFIHRNNIYNNTVKELFADNALLMNKWLRYGNNVRG